MILLWLIGAFTLVHASIDKSTLSGFGNAYLRNGNLCKQWTCINEKLHLPSSLPSKDQYQSTIRSLLPLEWEPVLNTALDVCYGNRPRMYTNTCPGQALLHCTIEQMIQNCPTEAWVKKDACAPLSSLSGIKQMFTQSRYENMEENLPNDRRPSWFLRHYFNTKCCNIPSLFNSTVMSECGFEEVIKYYIHTVNTKPGTDVLKHPYHSDNITPKYTLKVVNIFGDNITSKNESDDPLDCCDMKPFIQPEWRSDCDFHLQWKGEDRLAFGDQDTPIVKPKKDDPVKYYDAKVVPVSCDQSKCVFKELDILSPSGTLDLQAFSRLLDNVTLHNPGWEKVKPRVVTTCLSGRLSLRGCKINDVLTCVFDVLSENCPFTKKPDPCKSYRARNSSDLCQVSASLFRPRLRRQFCGIPELVSHELLAKCGIKSLSKVELVEERKLEKKAEWRSFHCKEMTPSSKCLMNKMGILNKYNFMDYFKLKNAIGQLSSEKPWTPFRDTYMRSYWQSPLYTEHCSSPKKLLNIVETVLMTCPISKRSNTTHCNQLFTSIANTPPKKDLSQTKLKEMLTHFQHVYLPHIRNPPKISKVIKSAKKTDDRNNVPNLNDIQVKTVDIIPQVIHKKPKNILPVYLRSPGKVSNSMYRNNLNSVEDSSKPVYVK